MFKFAIFLLLVFAGVLVVLGLLLLSGVRKWGVEWVLFGLAAASVIAQEVLRWKWEEREELEAQRYRYTQESRTRGSEGEDHDRHSRWFKIKKKKKRRGQSTDSRNKDMSEVTMDVTTNS